MLFGFISDLRLRALPTLKTVVLIKFCSGLVLIGSVTSAQESSSSRIEELTISATRQPRTIENIAGTVSLITVENIEKEMVDDLDDLARFQPGVSMSTNCLLYTSPSQRDRG